ncbi:MAG: hypothetical protein GXP13_05845, partial [Gammaproteobacteria bacterium]|nr:hypothetical protein [Gammaproteobacteria bacterium]
MAKDQEASILEISDHTDTIPTLNEIHHDLEKEELKLQAMVNHLAEELQTTLHQHLYQAMVKTMHQVVNEESKTLSGKILEKL